MAVAEPFVLAPLGLVPVRVWLSELLGSLLAGAYKEQMEKGDYWVKRIGGVGHDNCSGCFTCSVRVRPLRDVGDWAVERGKNDNMPREDIVWAIQEGIRLSGAPIVLSEMVE